jgi:hypothetical protein
MADDNTNSKTIENNSNRGFASHPENINRNGRPKRGWAWNELIEDAVNETVKNQAGEELEVKKLVVKRLVKMASEGDLQAIREIINRMDGMPVQPNAEIPEDQIDDYLHIYKPVKNEK